MQAFRSLLTAAFLATLTSALGQSEESPFVLRAHTRNAPEPSATSPVLQEEQPTGDYNQPEWTQHRRFSATRVYVQKNPWEIGFEQWWRGRFNRDNSHSHLLQEELEIGLPYRLQADLYENWVIDDDGHMRHHDFATELRWALADWGKIPLNPTLYAEWKFVDESQGGDVFEVKLLLGEQLAPRWHWGFNAIYEQEVEQSRATEWAFSQGLSYTVVDQKFSAGVEMKFVHETAEGSRSDAEIKFLLGPSIQWRPTPRIHLDIVPLAGLTHDSPRVEAFIVFGIDLFAKRSSQYKPASLRSN